MTSSSDILSGIVEEIKRKENAIQSVGVCFNDKSKKFDITVISKQPNEEVKSHIEMNLSERSSRFPGYELEVRGISKEGKHVTQSTEFIEFFEQKGYSKEIFKLREIISQNTDNLRKNRPNITSISFSPVKSTGYGTSEHIILKEPCIVIFVQVKFDNKRIPLWSDKIPEIIDGIRTDVREGFVETLMIEPQDKLNIGIGDQIFSSSNSGSVGPLVSNGRRTGFLTSLHVLLSCEDMKKIPGMSISELSHKSVYMGFDNNRPKIGEITELYPYPGNNEQSGYEVGLVELASNVDTMDGRSLFLSSF